MTQKFEILGQNFDHFGGLRGNCWPLWGCEKSFFTFFLNCSGVVLGMFRYYFRTWKAYFWVYLQLLRLIPELYTLLWGPAEALLNFDYAFAGLFIKIFTCRRLGLRGWIPLMVLWDCRTGTVLSSSCWLILVCVRRLHCDWFFWCLTKCLLCSWCCK